MKTEETYIIPFQIIDIVLKNASLIKMTNKSAETPEFRLVIRDKELDKTIKEIIKRIKEYNS